MHLHRVPNIPCCLHDSQLMFICFTPAHCKHDIILYSSRSCRSSNRNNTVNTDSHNIKQRNKNNTTTITTIPVASQHRNLFDAADSGMWPLCHQSFIGVQLLHHNNRNARTTDHKLPNPAVTSDHCRL